MAEDLQDAVGLEQAESPHPDGPIDMPNKEHSDADAAGPDDIGTVGRIGRDRLKERLGPLARKRLTRCTDDKDAFRSEQLKGVWPGATGE